MGEGKEVKLILEEERRKQMLKSLNLLEEIYGTKNIVKVLEWAHREDLLDFEARVGLIGRFPSLTKKGKNWIKHKT